MCFKTCKFDIETLLTMNRVYSTVVLNPFIIDFTSWHAMLGNFFRQINSLVIYLVNALFSWKFCQKSVENEKFSLTEKIFRQINSLVFYLVKTLLSRNFCQKSVKLFRLNFYNFHTVPRTLWNAKVEFCNHIFFRENIFLSFIFT